MVRKLGRFLTGVLPHRSGLATASSAAVPPCMPAGVLRSSSGRSKDTLGCASLRGARWCSPRGQRPQRRRDPLVGGALPLSHTDQWGRGPTVSRKGTKAGRDLGVFSVFHHGFELVFRKWFPENSLNDIKSISWDIWLQNWWNKLWSVL